MKKIFCGILVAFLLLGSLNYTVWATEDSNIYEETRDQISLDYLAISVTDGKSLHYTPRLKLLTKSKAEREKQKLDTLLEKAPHCEKLLIEAMNHNMPIHTISVTDVPVVFKDDHYERIKKENHSFLRVLFSPLFLTSSAAESSEGTPSSRGNFVMSMMISKIYNQQEQRYKYMTLTSGQWNAHSVFGGQNYPAMGEDIIAVTSPPGTCMDSCSLYTQYTNYSGETRDGSNGPNNPDFWLKETDVNYSAFSIKDDPLWSYQLNIFLLQTTFVGPQDSRMRKAVSTYVHSWSTVQFTIEIEKTLTNWEETVIRILPNHAEKTWECSCFVTFDF